MTANPLDSDSRLTLNVPEVARALGITRAYAYNLANRGQLPGAFRLGRRWLVSRSALEVLLAAGRQVPRQEHGDDTTSPS